MAYSFNGTTQYLLESAAPTTSTPVTLAGWFKKTSASVAGTCIAICNGSNDGNWRRTSMTGSAKVNCDVNSNYYAIEATGTYSAGAWVHVCGVITSSSSRTAYRDGGNSATGSGTEGTLTLTRCSIGVLARPSIVEYFDGDIAECGIWNVALTADEVAALGKGFSPRRIRPQSLIRYIPLVRDVRELRNAVTISPQNSPTAGAAHPRTYR
jgi:hypothetical protein